MSFRGTYYITNETKIISNIACIHFYFKHINRTVNKDHDYLLDYQNKL